MAEVTIFSDFGAQENKVCHCFHCFPSICHEVMGLDAMILVFWMLSFKLVFRGESYTGEGKVPRPLRSPGYGIPPPWEEPPGLPGWVLADSLAGCESSIWPGGFLPDNFQTPSGCLLYLLLITLSPPTPGSSSLPLFPPISLVQHWPQRWVWDDLCGVGGQGGVGIRL